MFSLLSDAWIPVRHDDGTISLATPATICAETGANPIVTIEWPRADFRIATLEFLIGLLATACPPRGADAWLDLWEAPPGEDALAAAFTPLAHAFVLDGDGPRFLQDLEDLPGTPDPPETLLIEAPGEATRRNNTALLVKPDRIQGLSRAAAAMALFTLQTYAPSGGRGNLTSLRGGGPLTTLVLPGAEPGRPVPLWRLLWANVPRGRPPAAADLPLVFPWLAPTRTADRFSATAPEEGAHPLQAFWGMPRRIRLTFAPNPHNRPCDLTGLIDPVIVTGWRQRPNGVRYTGWGSRHPLAPAYKDAKSGGWLPVHPQPGGIFYRHWVALADEGSAGTRRPAPAIITWRNDRAGDVGETVRSGTRLLAAGYDMDNMKARAFVESEMPLPGTADPAAAHDLAQLAEALIDAAEAAARALRLALRNARYSDDTNLDAGPLATAYEGLWQATQDAFFRHLADARTNPAGALTAIASDWRQLLRRTALGLFDTGAPLDPGAVSLDPGRIIRARRDLVGSFAGYGLFGRDMYRALLLPEPESKPAKPKPAKRKEKA